ncbi:hypothetical protein BJ138DRAFT_1100361 [Hygrophoropsis aurantiaca]|uniref:Uncharacterized protein n=1 Tax=Hygrophoropsis aurantiaca TaxID=72124 RepID=A0ACB8AG76_9AGAM|nr:hypothetical protein BJ138DRAFT_1100361 [Hygrophoropsis aurantiaca]
MAENTQPNLPSLSKPLNTQDDPTQFQVYLPPASDSTSINIPDLSDEYFTPTPADLKAAQATLSARTHTLINAPLQVRAVREAAQKLKRDKWPNTTIRIRFTDRTQLEKIFPSTDKIRSVYAFVRASLRDDVKPIKSILYQSPPKRDLKVSDPKVRDLTLAELQLAPSSVLLLRFEDESLNGSDIPAPLQPSIIAQAIQLPPAPRFDTEDTEQRKSNATPTAPSTNPGTEKKIPKWLQAGLRKK